jgi:CHAT domain-containing protein
MAILCPGGANLPSAAQEATNLATLITTSTPITPVNKEKVDELLRRLDVQIVHFSGHGVLGANADLTELQLDDGSITAPRFAQNALGTIAQPMLFLNACSVGRGGAVLGRSGGFAGLCVAAGWSGVIAPYWPVYDPSAAVFGIKLYQKLMSGCCIGEALQELRREYDKDPTVQSYAYFGDPFARLLFN